jgi:hypothetical protein
MILVVDDNLVQTSHATGKALVVISASVSSSPIGTKFRDVTVPVIVMEDDLYPDMGMTGSQGSQHGNTPPGTQVNIMNDTHALAAGLGLGNHAIYEGNDNRVWGVPGSAAIKIASLPSDNTKFAVFAYRTGDAMPGQPNNAPARRVGFFLYTGIDVINDTTSDGRLLFNAAVVWAKN